MIDAIVLAAGLATRMGEVKPLVSIGGEPALGAVLHRIEAAGLSQPIVVLGAPSAVTIEAAVDLSACTVVQNARPETGMAGSLRLGLDAVSPGRGVLIFHADMPFVAVATIDAVRRSAGAGARIAAPCHGGTRGFPVFFHHDHIEGLRASLAGDAGGRAYITQHLQELTEIPVEDPGCVYDIDRPADLSAWKGGLACSIGA